MDLKNIYEYERKKLEKLKRYQLPHTYKKIGWGLIFVSLLVLILKKFYLTDQMEIGQIAKNGMLVGMLVIIISKEKIEDELIGMIRGQAFSFAFIAGVVYALVMPLTDYIVDLVFKTKEASYSELGDFIILWFMMVMYLAFFTLLKRTR